MSTLNVYNSEGAVVKTVDLPAIFTVPVNEPLIHRYMVWVRTVIRPTIAHTKTRGDVSGGGKKPWKQKGTGRARVGSSRSPLWRTGGIVFGPRKTQNWATRMPRQERRQALLSALSAKASANNIVILDQLSIERPSTKEMKSLFDTLPTTVGKKVLVIYPTFEDSVFKATSNLPKVTTKTISYMNILDVLHNDVVLMTEDTLEKFSQQFN
jgi:large subunit ribosomal protein L4